MSLKSPDRRALDGALSRGVSEMARALQQSYASIEDTLVSITTMAVGMVPGTDHAGITLVTGRRTVESRAATGELPRRLDSLQQQCGQGPCLDAVWEQRTVHVEDMRSEHRWPQFASEAGGMGVRSMLAFQLYTGRDNLGALNLYSERANGFDSASEELGLLLATQAAVALIAAQHEDQMQSALASRDLIGQAKGMIMERYGIDAVQAFDLLSRLSQDWNTSVAELAGRVTQRP
ncbi:GAF and ANTAR domain-containing protein [Rhodococcus sp. BP22]|uniref:GAF and ANTAR domain-containing protein n=1 Tax=Rhodococcus sp. BP22 TaxID=2758566 RepID=UPI0016484B90|nr:GAF and ANTAR domain-containing protein [Rhodococcus sp. BP22]